MLNKKCGYLEQWAHVDWSHIKRRKIFIWMDECHVAITDRPWFCRNICCLIFLGNVATSKPTGTSSYQIRQSCIYTVKDVLKVIGKKFKRFPWWHSSKNKVKWKIVVAFTRKDLSLLFVIMTHFNTKLNSFHLSDTGRVFYQTST